MSVCRYIVVCGRHALGARLCSRQRAKLSIVAVVAATVLACSPNYVMYRPVPYDISATTPQVNVHHLNASARPDCVVLFASNTTALNMSAPYKTNPHTTPSDAGISNDTAGDADIVTYWFSSNDFVTDATRTINFWFLTRVAAGAKVSKAFTYCIIGVLLSLLLQSLTHTHTHDTSIHQLLVVRRSVEGGSVHRADCAQCVARACHATRRHSTSPSAVPGPTRRVGPRRGTQQDRVSTVEGLGGGGRSGGHG